MVYKFGDEDNWWGPAGEEGPCGPCSAIHRDQTSDEKKAETPGVELVNQDNPQVVEVWNLVFMELKTKIMLQRI